MPIIVVAAMSSTGTIIPDCLLVTDGKKLYILVELNTRNWGIISTSLLSSSSSPLSRTLSMVGTAIRILSTSYNYTNLRNVIKAINTRTRYGTHLSAVEMDEITNIIMRRCPTFSDLESEVKRPLLRGSTSNLFCDICRPFPSGDVNISFASKFYFSIDKFVTRGFSNFCKYDQIVAKKVAIYEEIYCGTAVKSNYVIASGVGLNMKYEAYLDYVKAIDRICKATRLNREQFDNIVWCTSK